jgi:hypothetical protein
MMARELLDYLAKIPLDTTKSRTYVQRSIELINKNVLSKEDRVRLRAIKLSLSESKFCFYCQSDCNDEYYSWSHSSLKLADHKAVKRSKNIIVCPSCYNVPIASHGTFGKKMVKHSKRSVHKHKGSTVEAIEK